MFHFFSVRHDFSLLLSQQIELQIVWFFLVLNHLWFGKRGRLHLPLSMLCPHPPALVVHIYICIDGEIVLY